MLWLRVRRGVAHAMLRHASSSEVEFWCGKQRDDADTALARRRDQRCKRCVRYLRRYQRRGT